MQAGEVGQNVSSNCGAWKYDFISTMPDQRAVCIRYTRFETYKDTHAYGIFCLISSQQITQITNFLSSMHICWSTVALSNDNACILNVALAISYHLSKHWNCHSNEQYYS